MLGVLGQHVGGIWIHAVRLRSSFASGYRLEKTVEGAKIKRQAGQVMRLRKWDRYLHRLSRGITHAGSEFGRYVPLPLLQMFGQTKSAGYGRVIPTGRG